MDPRTKSIAKNLPALALAVSLSALGLASANQAQADGAVAVSSLSGVSSAQGASAQPEKLAVLKAEKLYRFQARPWARIPEGVALQVRAPAGMTAADLHNAVSDCARKASDASPLCVAGADINVARNGGLYVVKITSDSRALALDIQERAERIK